MRLLVFVLLAPAAVVAVVGQAVQNNGVAEGIVAGLGCVTLLAMAVAFAPAKPKPRQADPAKIAALERELLDTEAPEAPTTVAKPPDKRTVDDCPRPEGCVMAHPCRKCGAERGQICVGDPWLNGRAGVMIASEARKARGIQ